MCLEAGRCLDAGADTYAAGSRLSRASPTPDYREPRRLKKKKILRPGWSLRTASLFCWSTKPLINSSTTTFSFLHHHLFFPPPQTSLVTHPSATMNNQSKLAIASTWPSSRSLLTQLTHEELLVLCRSIQCGATLSVDSVGPSPHSARAGMLLTLPSVGGLQTACPDVWFAGQLGGQPDAPECPRQVEADKGECPFESPSPSSIVYLTPARCNSSLSLRISARLVSSGKPRKMTACLSSPIQRYRRAAARLPRTRTARPAPRVSQTP